MFSSYPAVFGKSLCQIYFHSNCQRPDPYYRAWSLNGTVMSHNYPLHWLQVKSHPSHLCLAYCLWPQWPVNSYFTNIAKSRTRIIYCYTKMSSSRDWSQHDIMIMIIICTFSQITFHQLYCFSILVNPDSLIGLNFKVSSNTHTLMTARWITQIKWTKIQKFVFYKYRQLMHKYLCNR